MNSQIIAPDKSALITFSTTPYTMPTTVTPAKAGKIQIEVPTSASAETQRVLQILYGQPETKGDAHRYTTAKPKRGGAIVVNHWAHTVPDSARAELAEIAELLQPFTA